MTLMIFADNPNRTIFALLLALVVSMLAHHFRALTADGAAAAILVGTSLVSGSGWWSGLILILYFVSSSALSHVRSRQLTSTRQVRGHQRDHIQVLANGGIPAICALVALLSGSSVWITGSIVAISVATAATWATEVGRITQSRPRSIVTWRRVPPGTSGAVSTVGTSASVAGSLLIAGAAAIGDRVGAIDFDGSASFVFALIMIGGSCGSLLDSLLGATVQGTFHCDVCNETFESEHHSCGIGIDLVSGCRRIDNDFVNLISNAMPTIGAIVIQSIVV